MVWVVLSNAVTAAFVWFFALGAQMQFRCSTTTVKSIEDDKPCGFWDFFVGHNTGPGVHKWVHYFPLYEEHFGRFCRGNEKLRMAEIGVQSGGSMLMWRHAFGEKLQLLVGMDKDNRTKAWEEFGPNVKVEIGIQQDPVFLEGIKAKYPEGFDILLDDGSHNPEHQFITFVHMWETIRPGGVLFIEDVHGVNPLLHWLLHGHKNDVAQFPGLYYHGEEMGHPLHISVDTGLLNKYTGTENFKASKVQKQVESIKIYPYVVAITRRKVPLATIFTEKHGTQWIPI